MTIELKHIKNAVAQYFGVLPLELDKKTRNREIVVMRQIAHYLAVKYHSGIYRHIGELIGKCNHATVIHSVRQIDNALNTGERYNGIKIEIIVKSCEAIAYENEVSKNRKRLTPVINECNFIMC
jgi:chromosomal replication initiation ATPase DnaA